MENLIYYCAVSFSFLIGAIFRIWEPNQRSAFQTDDIFFALFVCFGFHSYEDVTNFDLYAALIAIEQWGLSLRLRSVAAEIRTPELPHAKRKL